jgi:hypothetical protein
MLALNILGMVVAVFRNFSGFSANDNSMLKVDYCVNMRLRNQ